MATNKELEQGRQVFGENSAGYNAFKDAYERLKGQAQAQKQSVGQSYANIYQQALSQQYDRGLGAAAASGGFTGGQRQMQTQRANANTMGVLSNIQTQGRQALSDVEAQGASAYSNALLEGQQAQEYANTQRQSNYQREVMIAEIRNNKDLSNAEKQAQINALLGGQEGLSNRIKSDVSNIINTLGQPVGASELTPMAKLNELAKTYGYKNAAEMAKSVPEVASALQTIQQQALSAWEEQTQDETWWERTLRKIS